MVNRQSALEILFQFILLSLFTGCISQPGHLPITKRPSLIPGEELRIESSFEERRLRVQEYWDRISKYSFVETAFASHRDSASARLECSLKAIGYLAFRLRVNVLSVLSVMEEERGPSYVSSDYFATLLSSEEYIPATVIPIADQVWKNEEGDFCVIMHVICPIREYYRMVQRQFRESERDLFLQKMDQLWEIAHDNKD